MVSRRDGVGGRTTTNHSDGVAQGWGGEEGCSTTNHSDGVAGAGWGVALLTTVMVSCRYGGCRGGRSTTNHSDGVTQGWGVCVCVCVGRGG